MTDASEIFVEILETDKGFQELREEWEGLWRRLQAEATVSPSWYAAYLQAFPNAKICVFVVRVRGVISGVWPIQKKRMGLPGLFQNIVTSNFRGDFQPPLVGVSDVGIVVPPLVDAIWKKYGRQNVFQFSGIDTEAPIYKVLVDHLARKKARVGECFDVAPRLSVLGRSYEDIESGWSRSHRGDVKRQIKRLSEIGSLELRSPSEFQEARASLEDFFEVHDEKWLSQGQPGRFASAQERTHYSAILKEMWGAGAVLSVLVCNEISISYIFGFESHGWIQSYRPTFRQSFEKYSPSKVHLAFLLKEICVSGRLGIDFLIGREGYKYVWSNEERRVSDIYADTRPLPVLLHWMTRVKPWLKDRLWNAYANARAATQNYRKRWN